VLGIDPGLRGTGFGLLRQEGDDLSVLEFGAISTEPAIPVAERLYQLFTAIGRLNKVDGYTLKFCLADRGEGGRHRDSARVQLFNPGGTLIYDSYASGDYGSQDNTLTGVCANRYKLSGGNFQIHSGLK